MKFSYIFMACILLASLLSCKQEEVKPTAKKPNLATKSATTDAKASSLNVTAQLLSNYSVSFRVTNPSIISGRRVYYRWVFGDGVFTSTDDPTITYTYPRVRKSYTVRVYERDIRTNEVIKEGTVNILVKNIPRNLVVTGRLLANYQVAFSVTNPGTSSGQRVYYRWVFGDGVFTSTDDPSVTHTYPRIRKSYTVKVYERDINTDEVLGEGSIDILVTNVQQPLNITARLLPNYQVAFNVTNANTSGATNVRRKYYRWVFGDGVFTSTDDPSITHTYPRVRKSYIVKVYERDIRTNEVIREGSVNVLVKDISDAAEAEK